MFRCSALGRGLPALTACYVGGVLLFGGCIPRACAREGALYLMGAVRSGDDLVTWMRFDFELGDPSHLGDIVRRLKSIESVYDAHRIGARKHT